jgi:phage tail-like protein
MASGILGSALSAGSSALSAIIDGDQGYPAPAFYFKVSFAATLGMTDTSFQEVSGITTEVTTENVIEGGENRYVHKLPTGIKHGNLELKRGIAPMTSPLVLWCRSVMEMDFIVPIIAQPIIVSLMNKDRIPIRVWTFANAFPIKWDVTGFNSEKSEVAIEKIVLSYTYSNRMV